MLKTANVQIKVMNQLLDRLIPSDDNHTKIEEKKNYSIEVMPQNLMTFRVPAKNCNSPAKFTITFNGDADKKAAQEEYGVKSTKSKSAISKDLRIYIS